MKIRFAVTPPATALHEDQFNAYLEACETLGFDTIWLSDVPLGPLGDPLLSLTYAAARTTRLKLGMNVVPLGRNPMWLTKQLAHLDRLFRGRASGTQLAGRGGSTDAELRTPRRTARAFIPRQRFAQNGFRDWARE